MTAYAISILQHFTLFSIPVISHFSPCMKVHSAHCLLQQIDLMLLLDLYMCCTVNHQQEKSERERGGPMA